MVSTVECTSFRSIDTNNKNDREFDYHTNFAVLGEVNDKMKNWAPGDWMRPVGDVEMMFAIGAYLKSLNTLQAVYVSSDEPLSKELMNTALQHLVRRIPILNVCMQRRGTQLWYRRVSKISIDFDIQDDDPNNVVQQVLGKTYNLKKGPLWSVRMVPLAEDHPTPRGICAKNQVVIIFGVLHAITDASTNMIICKELVNILNDLKKGRPVEDKPYLFCPPHAEKLVDSTKTFLFKYFLKRFYNVLVLDFNKKTTFNGVLPLAKNYKVETRVLNYVFSEEITEKLIARCKENKATIHSCIVTCANVSYLDIAQQKSSETLDEVAIYYSDSINLRRYYPKTETEHIGCHITICEQQASISTEGRQDFWRSARSSKAALHASLSDKNCLKIMPIMRWAAIVFPFNIYHNKKRTRNLTDSHYITTNMGDVSNIIGDNNPDEPVHINDIFRSVNGEQCGHYFALSCETFRKRMHLSIDYYSNKMTDETASEYFDILKRNLTDLALNGVLS